MLPRLSADRLIWERAAIQSRVSPRVLELAADVAREQEARHTERILRQLSQAVAEPEFRYAATQLTDFARRARAGHYPRVAAAIDAVVSAAEDLTPDQLVLRNRMPIADDQVGVAS
jgi:hypothetical protein